MSTSELHIFWFFFSSNLAYSEASAVPDWKTREQLATLKEAGWRLYYYPAKDAAGNFTVDRDGFETHIIAQLNTIVRERRELRIAELRLPTIVKIHHAIGILAAYGVYALMAVGVLFLITLPLRRLIGPLFIVLAIAVSSLWYSYLVLGLIRSFLQHKRKRVTG